jgi:hypothetical protein
MTFRPSHSTTTQPLEMVGATCATPRKQFEAWSSAQKKRKTRGTSKQDAYQLSEREIQTQIIEYLQWTGWMVIEFSQYAPVRGNICGVPDLLCIKNGTALFLECKNKRGKLRPSQEEFAARILPHVCETVRYAVVHSIDELIQVVTR